jgi:hypothetical protein
MPTTNRFFSILARVKKRVMGFFVGSKEIKASRRRRRRRKRHQLRSKDQATRSAARENTTPLVSGVAGKPNRQGPQGPENSAGQQLPRPDYEGFGLSV